MNKYEVVFIALPDLDEEGLTALAERYTESVKSLGGQVDQVENWGKRRLAYPIHKLQEGYYFVSQIQSGPETLKELDRSLRLNEQVVRFLITCKEE
ncbi:MAG: 30S ribosomal protein S6 [Chloroflexi bacterium]|nr:30S ribosomal protein S6 [Chloroflexota bacterium]